MSKKSPWKSNLIRPSRRRSVFSKQLGKWLDENDAEALHELLAQKQKQIVDALASTPDASNTEASVEKKEEEQGVED